MTDTRTAINERLDAEPETVLFAVKYAGENYSVVPDYDTDDPEHPEKVVKTLGNLLFVLAERADVDPVALARDGAQAAKAFDEQPGVRRWDELG